MFIFIIQNTMPKYVNYKMNYISVGGKWENWKVSWSRLHIFAVKLKLIIAFWRPNTNSKRKNSIKWISYKRLSAASWLSASDTFGVLSVVLKSSKVCVTLTIVSFVINALCILETGDNMYSKLQYSFFEYYRVWRLLREVFARWAAIFICCIEILFIINQQWLVVVIIITCMHVESTCET